MGEHWLAGSSGVCSRSTGQQCMHWLAGSSSVCSRSAGWLEAAVYVVEAPAGLKQQCM